MSRGEAILIVYAVASAAAFIAFGVDKRAAMRSARRVPESWLHMLELLGGWPGALLAAGVFRHKRRKVRYMVILSAIALLHIAGWIAWFALRGR